MAEQTSEEARKRQAATYKHIAYAFFSGDDDWAPGHSMRSSRKETITTSVYTNTLVPLLAYLNEEIKIPFTVILSMTHDIRRLQAHLLDEGGTKDWDKGLRGLRLTMIPMVNRLMMQYLYYLATFDKIAEYAQDTTNMLPTKHLRQFHDVGNLGSLSIIKCNKEGFAVFELLPNIQDLENINNRFYSSMLEYTVDAATGQTTAPPKTDLLDIVHTLMTNIMAKMEKLRTVMLRAPSAELPSLDFNATSWDFKLTPKKVSTSGGTSKRKNK